MAACARPPRVWLNSSTATIYPDTPGAAPANTEAAATPGVTFSEQVGRAWERAFLETKVPAATRRVALRTAIVLGSDGGAFPVVARLARFGLCTPQAGGQQWISWLHVQDFCRAVQFVADNEVLAGPVNVCAPHPLPNAAFNALLLKALDPPLHLPQPRWLLEIGAFVLRTETELILKSRKVYPARLVAAGFRFEYPECKKAVGELLGVEDTGRTPSLLSEKQKRLVNSFISTLGILLSCIGCCLTMVPYIGIIFLPVSFFGSLLVLLSPLTPRSKTLLVLFPYVVPIAIFIFYL